MFRVIFTKGSLRLTYGTYATRELAEDAAEVHRSLGYWSVSIEQV